MGPETDILTYSIRGLMALVLGLFGFSLKRMRQDIDANEKQLAALELKVAENYPTKKDFDHLEEAIKDSIKEIKTLLTTKQDRI
jgi:hypothetical protein